MAKTPAGTPPHPKGPERFNEDRATYTVRSSQPDLQAGVAAIRESLSAALFRLEEPMNVIFSAVNLLRRRDPASASMLEDALDASRVHLDALREVIPPRGPETMSNINLNEILRDVLDTVEWEPAA